jgi:hypothetical protein
MTFSSLVDRLDDWINPIVVKEVRQAVKSRLVVSVLMVFLVLMLLVMGVALSFQQASNQFGDSARGMGRNVFMSLQMLLLPTIMLVIPVYAAIRMGAERSETNADLLFISTLSPGSIISGKFVAAMAFAMLIFSIFAPFMTFTYLLRGIDIPTIAFILWIDVLAMVVAILFALFLASIPGPMPLRVFAISGGFVFIFICFCYWFGISTMLIQFPRELVTDSELLWTSVAITTILIALVSAMIYFYAVALISPPSSNRIRPIRVTLLVFWLVTGLTLFGWALSGVGLPPSADAAEIPVGLWVSFNMMLLCVQFLLSTCERDTWGPRLARTIPRFAPFRLVAFFFYTGAAGGVLLTLILMAATLALGFFARITIAEHAGGLKDFTPLDYCLVNFAAIAAYTVCYGLSGALIRYYFLRETIRNAYTWVITACLLGIGSIVPWMFSIILLFDHAGQQPVSWWLVANPFAALFELSMMGMPWRGGNTDFIGVMWIFLGAWGVLLIVPTLWWILAQARRFVPYVRKYEPKSEPIRALPAEPVALSAVPVDQAAVQEQRFPPGADPSAVTPG